MITDLRKNPIGIYEKAIPNRFSWLDKIRIAKSSGFDFIEISIDESDQRLERLFWSKSEKNMLRELLQEHDFEIRSMCLSGHRKYPFGSHDPQVRKKARQIIDLAIEFSAFMGIKNVQLAGYDVYYEDSDIGTQEHFVEGLKYATQKAEAANIMLSIEVMDTYLCGTLSRVKKFLDRVNSPYLRIYPDLGNLSRWTQQPCKELEQYFSDIVAIHLKDTKPDVFKCVPFGEGTVLFEPMFSLLSNKNYSGPFLIEMWADDSIDLSFEEVVVQLKQAKAWLKERMV